MSTRWDDTAVRLVREIAADLTALDATVEVLKPCQGQDAALRDVDRLTKQLLRRQLDLLDHLKG